MPYFIMVNLHQTTAKRILKRWGLNFSHQVTFADNECLVIVCRRCEDFFIVLINVAQTFI